MHWQAYPLLLKLSAMEDQKLVQRCLEGDRQSLEKLIASVQGLIFNLSDQPKANQNRGYTDLF